MCDVSDGLLGDLGHVAAASGVGINLSVDAFDFDEDLMSAAAALAVDPLSWVLTGGEDHALVATFPPALRRPRGWRLIGEVTPGEGVLVDGEPWSSRGGHDHFAYPAGMPANGRSLDADTLIIGASAAGLATAAMLKQAGHSFRLLEATDVVGTAWRHHYDRLHLHTPKSGSALPGLPMPGEWSRYASRDQMVDYLERYRVHHGLEPVFGERVSVVKPRDGGWIVRTASREWTSRAVVVATGAAREPVRPVWPGLESYDGEVLHSSEYRNGRPWAGRTVLVVGFGNSACEQAIDLVESGAAAHLSVRSAVNVVPRDVLGLVPVLQLGIAMRRLPPRVADALAAPVIRLTVGDLRKVGLRKLPYGPNTQMARDHHVPLLDIGTMQLVRDGRIAVHPGIERFTSGGVVFSDGQELVVDAVVLGTGYRPALEDFLPDWRLVCDEQGRPLVSGGPTALPGLFFCGQFVSPSGMLRECGIEAKRIAAHLSRA
jgi:cation diffusion facilitator CzcD-associated flavoprotein CzcO